MATTKRTTLPGRTTTGCLVTVCRDCCCGNARKNPKIDHDGQLVRLREALPAPHQLRVSECLDACAEANVIVVHPNPAARRLGARAVWFGLVGDDQIEEDIATWVRDGGPGVAPMPAILELSVLRR